MQSYGSFFLEFESIIICQDDDGNYMISYDGDDGEAPYELNCSYANALYLHLNYHSSWSYCGLPNTNYSSQEVVTRLNGQDILTNNIDYWNFYCKL